MKELFDTLFEKIVGVQGLDVRIREEEHGQKPVFTISNRRTIKQKQYQEPTDGVITKVRTSVQTDFFFGIGRLRITATAGFRLQNNETVETVEWQVDEQNEVTQITPQFQVRNKDTGEITTY